MGGMLQELETAIDAAGLTDRRYAATIELARRYAAAIDAGEELPKVGPALLAALNALGLTIARTAAKGGEPDAGARANPLDELRQRRQQRTG